MCPKALMVHQCTRVLLPFTTFYCFICLLQFFKEDVNYKACVYEGREISASSKTCSTLHGICCVCCNMPKQMALTSFFLCAQVHFPDVERVEWLNKVRSCELQLVRPSALSCHTAQILRAEPEKADASLLYCSIDRCLYLSLGAT